MRKVMIYSGLLLMGLVASQWLPSWFGGHAETAALVVRVLTMTGLAFIMIHVGFEFHIDKSNLRKYGWDYIVAFTAATFPWVFVALYFVFVMLPAETWSNWDAWKESLLAGRFAAPTSAGVLFSMLAAAGLTTTWLFRKARILAIFDDLDTVLLMIPLKMLMVGLAWQLGMVVLLMIGLLGLAYIFLHRVSMPVSWAWVLAYAGGITLISELVYAGTKWYDPTVPIHIEVLLPAFVLGCIARPRRRDVADPSFDGRDPQVVEHKLHALLDHPGEKRAAGWISGFFMVFVGLSMPVIFNGAATSGEGEAFTKAMTVTSAQPAMGWGEIAMHVLIVTLISNVGKMFPAFCYRREAHWRERLAVAVGMWPRGEVGAGVLVVSLSYGIGGPIVTVAMLSLALNLVLTGLFIMIVRKLLAGVPSAEAPAESPVSENPVGAMQTGQPHSSPLQYARKEMVS